MSFEPPPCDEFTTNEPRRSATRVSPPGNTSVCEPVRMNGRRSMWRASSLPSTKVGWLESCTSSCAMKPRGSRSISLRLISSWSAVACGPITIP